MTSLKVISYQKKARAIRLMLVKECVASELDDGGAVGRCLGQELRSEGDGGGRGGGLPQMNFFTPSDLCSVPLPFILFFFYFYTHTPDPLHLPLPLYLLRLIIQDDGLWRHSSWFWALPRTRTPPSSTHGDHTNESEKIQFGA